MFVTRSLTIILSLLLVSTAGAQSMESLSDLQWENRMILVKASSNPEKDRSGELDLERLFSRIDQMPMRIREMREQDEGE